MKRSLLLVPLSLWGILFSLSSVQATLVPSLDLEALTSQADLIAVGRIAEVRREGPAMLHIQSAAVAGYSMLARLDVERVVKGNASSGSLSFRFALPDAPAGYAGIGDKQFGVFFLRKDTLGFQILDPYHPFVVAAPGASPVAGSYADQVIAEVVHVFASPTMTADTRLRAVLVLDAVRTPLATHGLKRAAQDPDPRTRIWAMAALLRRNDISLLDSGEQVMLSSDPKIDQNLKGALAYALRDGVKDPRAIPVLTRLLRATDVNVRRGAAAALRNTQDNAAIRPLTQALYDSDRDVQYQAVIGLAELTGTIGEWAPAYETFLKDPQSYVTHWRGWAK